jgi:threonine synthase
LFHLFGEDPGRVRAAFAELKAKGRIMFGNDEMEQVRRDFCSTSVDEAQTLDTIGRFYKETGYLLDPHTAVGVHAALGQLPGDSLRVCLATAHPAKFGAAVEKAIGAPAPVPPAIAALEGKPARCVVMDADLAAVRAYIVANIG